ncbi:hypothetical protein NUU61_002851 [Penicillium alfredii]|uniref:UspA domain-containing protein n=1 Tax=Penicillium alfredii TaxID=1506179 RepID=A0A9W9FSB0_9EURO|nr:uncharacterized protein NUU61_002851 [Penicillium alfredii]KAJ5105504.1 hypothetical protein NUU61_002851 [Penicillium alfredii]
MSAPTSPKSSFESDRRPQPRAQSPALPAGSSPTHNSSSDDRPRNRSPRRRSIQFNVEFAQAQLPTRSHSFKDKRRSYGDPLSREVDEKDHRPALTPRGPSPPPPKTYERGVSFDTFDNRDAADFSLTLNYKHKGYQSTRRSRTFLCGTDQNDYSEFALEWLIDELVDDGDEIVCLRAVEKDSRMASDAAIEEGKYRKEAERLFEQVIQKNSQDEKAISLVLELAVGKVENIIQRMIRIYEPAMLVVGTRGRNLKGVHSLLPGSVSKYCLQQSPIPVIVVRPTLKREKKKKKRRADPTRRSYNHILEMSEQRGSRIFDASSSTESSISRLPDEEAAVAEALGLPPHTQMPTRASSLSHDDSDSTFPARHPHDTVLMKSPTGSSPASSQESVVVSDDTRRPPSPAIPVHMSPPVDQDSSDEGQPSNQEADQQESTKEESDTAQQRASIPLIEVSNDNDDKGKTEEPQP